MGRFAPLAAALALAGCTAAPPTSSPQEPSEPPPVPAAPEAAPAPPVEPPPVKPRSNLRVVAAADYHSDSARGLAWMEDAVTALSREFAAVVPVESWDRHRITLQLLAPRDGASEGEAGIRTRWDGDVCVAMLGMLAPSAHRAGGRTLAGLPFDDDYFRKTVIHEFASIALDAVTRSKGGGWKLYSAPSWFVQGAEEWLAITLGPRESGKVVWTRYLEAVRGDPAQLTEVEGSLRVANPYLGGTVFVGFLHEEFGKEKVRALLASREATFDAAFVATLGAAPAALLDRFRAWLAK